MEILNRLCMYEKMKNYCNIFLYFDVRNIALNVADFESEAF